MRIHVKLGRENIRNNNNVIDNTKMKLARNSFVIRGTENWNLLPPDIRKIQKIKKFQTLAKTWILENVPRFV